MTEREEDTNALAYNSIELITIEIFYNINQSVFFFLLFADILGVIIRSVVMLGPLHSLSCPGPELDRLPQLSLPFSGPELDKLQQLSLNWKLIKVFIGTVKDCKF